MTITHMPHFTINRVIDFHFIERVTPYRSLALIITDSTNVKRTGPSSYKNMYIVNVRDLIEVEGDIVGRDAFICKFFL